MEPPEATCRHRCLPRITCSQLPLIFDPPGGQDSPDEYREYTQKVIPGDAASHNNMISSFYASSDPLPSQLAAQPEPPPVIVDDEQEWEVEDIPDSRRFGRNRQLKYFVRWVGYDHPTW
jgi:hypothetical protein